MERPDISVPAKENKFMETARKGYVYFAKSAKCCEIFVTANVKQHFSDGQMWVCCII